MSSRVRAVLVAAALVCGAAGAVWRFAVSAGPAPVGSSVFLFGIDGLEWRVLAPLLDAGELPTLSRLMAAGRAGYLTTLRPTVSPAIWTSVATGKKPRRHGILSFVREAADGGKRQSYSSRDRTTKAIWNILSEHDRSSIVIGWWATFPAERIRGVMVSQMNSADSAAGLRQGVFKGALVGGVRGQVHPPAHEEAVLHTLAEVDRELPGVTLEMFGRFPHAPDPLGQRMWNDTQWAFRADATYVRVAERLLAHEPPPALFALYLGGTDVVAHRFWRHAYPAEFSRPPDAQQLENFARILPHYYRWVDRAIGALLAGRPDVSVFVVSDHGMHATNRHGDFRATERPGRGISGDHDDGPPGVLIASGPLIAPEPHPRPAGPLDPRTLPTLGSVLDVTPTILALEGIAVGWDMDGRPLWDLLEPTVRRRARFRWVFTHDERGWTPPAPEPAGVIDETERLQQLRALGYIE